MSEPKKASPMQVKDYLSVPTKPVTMTELKELSKEDREELALLVGAEL